MNTQKKYDLEERTLGFARNVRSFIKHVPKTLANTQDCKQLVRSSGSVGANYIEANDSLGDKDKLMKIRICRKEAKESRFWLMLIEVENNTIEEARQILIRESSELTLIFGAILQKLIQTKQPTIQEIRIP